MKKEFYTPEIDTIIERYGTGRFGNYNRQSYHLESKKILKMLQRLLESIEAIKPKLDGRDKVWSLWIRSKRGPVSVFMDSDEYEDLKTSGEIEDTYDLESLRNSYYPEEITWHKVFFRIFDNTFILGFDSKLTLQLDIETRHISGIHIEKTEFIEFLLWLVSEVENEINSALRNIDAYNNYIDANLPLTKRFGKIKRMELWEHIPEIKRLDDDLGEENIKCFEALVSKINEQAVIDEITADKFFSYCELCYDANEYFTCEHVLAPRQKYTEMADGRDGGLLDIAGDSQSDFNNWYTNDERKGEHPWEICRGGNSTHISLMVSKKADGWQLYLAGYSWGRAVETAKMAIALYNNDIPFVLAKAQEMLNMIKGADYCGIVPENITPKYCHSCFPDKDKIIDFINPWHEEIIVEVIKKHAVWYPIERLELCI
jgi:hypothetical protein